MRTDYAPSCVVHFWFEHYGGQADSDYRAGSGEMIFRSAFLEHIMLDLKGGAVGRTSVAGPNEEATGWSKSPERIHYGRGGPSFRRLSLAPLACVLCERLQNACFSGACLPFPAGHAPVQETWSHN